MGVVVVAGILLLVSLAGPAWLFSPAQPEKDLPEDFLSFSDLAVATAQGPSSIQAAYFGWLGWTLVILTIAVSFAVVVLPQRLLISAEVVIGVFALIITALALKGPLTWGGFVEAVPTLRLGGYLIIVGLILVIAHGVQGLSANVRRPAAAPVSDTTGTQAIDRHFFTQDRFRCAAGHSRGGDLSSCAPNENGTVHHLRNLSEASRGLGAHQFNWKRA